jgi:hypothetical protein
MSTEFSHSRIFKVFKDFIQFYFFSVRFQTKLFVLEKKNYIQVEFEKWGLFMSPAVSMTLFFPFNILSILNKTWEISKLEELSLVVKKNVQYFIKIDASQLKTKKKFFSFHFIELYFSSNVTIGHTQINILNNSQLPSFNLCRQIELVTKRVK